MLRSDAWPGGVVPKIHGILESSLYVSDVLRSVRFYQETFGFRVIKEFGERGCAMRSVNVRCCCSSRRELRVRSNRLTTGTANYMSRLLLHRPSWTTGNPGSEREESKRKRSEIGNWEDGACTFETRIDI